MVQFLQVFLLWMMQLPENASSTVQKSDLPLYSIWKISSLPFLIPSKTKSFCAMRSLKRLGSWRSGQVYWKNRLCFGCVATVSTTSTGIAAVWWSLSRICSHVRWRMMLFAARGDWYCEAKSVKFVKGVLLGGSLFFLALAFGFLVFWRPKKYEVGAWLERCCK